MPGDVGEADDVQLSRMIVGLAKGSARRSLQEAVNTLVGAGIEEIVAKAACRAALYELLIDLITETQEEEGFI